MVYSDDNQLNIDWLNEKIDRIENDKFLYKFICFLLGGPKHRLTYKEVYLILYNLNKKSLGEEKAKKKSIAKILQIYKNLHNNELPNGIEYDDK